MRHVVHPVQEHPVGGYNGAAAPQVGPQVDTADHSGTCPQGTEGRWMCQSQYCGRGNWPEEASCPWCERQQGTRGGGGEGGQGAALYGVHRGGHRGGRGMNQSGVSPNYRGRNPRVVTNRGQGAPRAHGPHTAAAPPRGSLNAGPRGNGGSRAAWRGWTPHRGRFRGPRVGRGGQGGRGRGRGSEPQDPCTQ